MITAIVIVAILVAISLVIALLGRGPSPQDSLREHDPVQHVDGGRHGKGEWDQGTFD